MPRIKCMECRRHRIIDMLNGKSGIRCVETGRVIAVFKTGHEVCVERQEAPLWCGREKA